MRPVDEHPELRRMLLTLRIIVIFLACGLGGFLLYVQFGMPSEPTEKTPVITYMAAGAAGLMIVVGGFLRISSVRKARDQFARRDVRGFCQAYQTAVIVWCALLEGPGFMATVAYLQERQPLGLAVASLMVLLLIASIPTRKSVNTLLEAVP